MTVMVGIREITRNTSKVIHQAAAGEQVIITEHGRPLAMIVPLPHTGSALLDKLIREGLAIPASNPGGIAELLKIEPVPQADPADSAEIVSEQRDERL